jgi:hypothetical protein
MLGTVFIHTNPRQMLGAYVSRHSLRRNSARSEAFDVRIISTDDHPFLAAREGQPFLRDGATRVWHMDDLQSFTPLRFMPPELMDYDGRAVVIDPDVFAQGDIAELLERDMQGRSILVRAKTGSKAKQGLKASSVMLLDCAKLGHWQVEKTFDKMFTREVDYMDWISLCLENPASLGSLEPQWNDLDHLDSDTKLIHNTKRWTQPWKTGLPVDFVPGDRTRAFPPIGYLRRARRKLFGDYGLLGRYKRHPDPNQEAFFFGMLRECLEEGEISEAFLRGEMAQNHVRHDAFEVLDRVPRSSFGLAGGNLEAN